MTANPVWHVMLYRCIPIWQQWASKSNFWYAVVYAELTVR